MLTFFVGSYTKWLTPDFGGTGKGIYTLRMNTDTGELNILDIHEAVNPSYMVMSRDNQYLYSITEVAQDEMPKVISYRVKENFSLAFMNEQPIPGGYPCHIELLNNNALIACYETGNVIQFPLNPNGELLSYKNNHYHSGSGANKERQEAPHAHQIAIHPDEKDIYVCDLGIDVAKAYQFMPRNDLVANKEKDIALSQGGGVRHMVFNNQGTIAYALNELTGTISTLKHIPTANGKGKFEQINILSALPPDYKGLPSGSAIRIHPRQTFLYAANRQLDAITIFSINGDQLELLDYQYTGGEEVREFNITQDGEWLIACHQNSHDTVSYKIMNDGKLIESFRTREIQSPVCITLPK